MTDCEDDEAIIGVIGGSGLYQIEGFEEGEEILMKTPFGDPSDAITCGELAGRKVCFLPRHGRGHRILPTELNHRANVWALRSLGVRWMISITAVGSLREEYHPRDIVLPDQFFDRLSRRDQHTFFGRGIVAHVSFADPISARLREILHDAASRTGQSVHDGGVYVCMDGPAFSTRAESDFHRRMGFDIVGMTNLPEAKLAREAEIAFATMAMITDYDCWRDGEEAVSAHSVIEHVQANATTAKAVLRAAIPLIPQIPDWPEHRALDGALFTDSSLWPAVTTKELEPILKKFIKY